MLCVFLQKEAASNVVIKKIVYVCPACEETVHGSIEDVSFSMIASEVVVTLECPSCGALMEDEPLDVG